MAHFSTGTEGQMYEEKFCHRCVYWVGDVLNIGSEMGCPVWELHFLHNGDRAWQPILDTLIPMERGHPGTCSTFRDRRAEA